MSYRCVVVDDEKPARDRIRRLLADHSAFELVGEAADAGAAVELIDRERPDLCFLDIKMPEGDGFRVLDRATHQPHVIFTTAFDEYAVRAFEVNSLDYLLKPFSRSRFSQALQRAVVVLQEKGAERGQILRALEEIRSGMTRPEGVGPGPTRVTARRGAKIVLLDPEEILWCEAEDTLIFAYTQRGRFLVERTLSDLEQGLGQRFFRAHRRYLVNLSQIQEILPGEAGTYRIVMRDEASSVVPLSRRQSRRLRERFPW